MHNNVRTGFYLNSVVNGYDAARCKLILQYDDDDDDEACNHFTCSLLFCFVCFSIPSNSAFDNHTGGGGGGAVGGVGGVAGEKTKAFCGQPRQPIVFIQN